MSLFYIIFLPTHPVYRYGQCSSGNKKWKGKKKRKRRKREKQKGNTFRCVYTENKRKSGGYIQIRTMQQWKAKKKRRKTRMKEKEEEKKTSYLNGCKDFFQTNCNPETKHALGPVQITKMHLKNLRVSFKHFRSLDFSLDEFAKIPRIIFVLRR
jgi:hypothetical protein